MRRARVILALVQLALLCGCGGLQRKPVAMGGAAVPAAMAAPGEPFRLLVWDASPSAGEMPLVYEVYRSNDLVEWGGYWVGPETNCSIQLTGLCGFFRVRARNTQSGLVSDWGSDQQ